MHVQLGAFVNETFQAREGFPPDLFPEEVPVYMGHYHKPHRVQGSSIEYIGSPYQGVQQIRSQAQRSLSCAAVMPVVLHLESESSRNIWMQ